MKIRTSHDRPPISTRSFDWSAVTEFYQPGDSIGHGSTEAEAIADLQSQIDSSDDEPFATNRYSEAPSPLVGLLPLMSAPRKDEELFCASCHTPAILSDDNLCCACAQEARLTSALLESRPLYILRENLSYHRVIAFFHTNIPHRYSVIVPDISSRLTCDITDFHLSIPSLVTTGIARANDAILRFNHLHKQHLSLS